MQCDRIRQTHVIYYPIMNLFLKFLVKTSGLLIAKDVISFYSIGVKSIIYSY